MSTQLEGIIAVTCGVVTGSVIGLLVLCVLR